MAASLHLPSSQRLAHVAEGRVQADAGTLLLSSATSPWAGFRLERLSFASDIERRVYWPTTRIGFVVSGAMKLEERQSLGAKHQFVARPGSVTIWPQNYECATLSWDGRGEVIGVEITPSTLRQVFPDADAGKTSGPVQRAIHDKHLASLLLAMEAEIRSGCPSGRVYGESLSLAVAAYIVGRYSIDARSLEAARSARSATVFAGP